MQIERPQYEYGPSFASFVSRKPRNGDKRGLVLYIIICSMCTFKSGKQTEWKGSEQSERKIAKWNRNNENNVANEQQKQHMHARGVWWVMCCKSNMYNFQQHTYTHSLTHSYYISGMQLHPHLVPDVRLMSDCVTMRCDDNDDNNDTPQQTHAPWELVIRRQSITLLRNDICRMREAISNSRTR